MDGDTSEAGMVQSDGVDATSTAACMAEEAKTARRKVWRGEQEQLECLEGCPAAGWMRG